MKKTFTPRQYASPEDAVEHLKRLRNIDLERMGEYLLYSQGLLPYNRSKEDIKTILDGLRDRALTAIKTTREILDEGLSSLQFQIRAMTPGSWEWDNASYIREFYETHPQNYLAGAAEKVETTLSAVQDELSGKFLRFVSSWLTKWADNTPFSPDTIELEYSVGDMKVIFDGNYSLVGVRENSRDPRDLGKYLEYIRDARALLDRKGFRSVWYGKLFVTCESCGGENSHGKELGVGGHYVRSQDAIYLYVNPSSFVVDLLVHELGHRYYYRFMQGADRARFDSYFGHVKSVTSYGDKSAAEDFAETFMHYVTEKHMSRDQIDRFKAFLAADDHRRVTADSSRVASAFLSRQSDAKSTAMMKFLSGVATDAGVGRSVYVVGGAVRNFLLGVPVKDVDIVVDSIALGGRDADWFAKVVAKSIPVETNVTTNQYGVAILTIKGDWELEGINLRGEVIEIANARKESYDGVGGKGKGYKPTDVSPATIDEDVFRREFTFNTLLWRLHDLASGPDKAEILDITGLGRQHLEQKMIHTPLDPDKTFRDDPTRMLRALKFLLRYDLSIDPEVAASIRRNAPRLKDMPWEAVGNLLVRDILSSPKARHALKVMSSLGLVEVLAEMVRDTPAFAAFLTRQLAAGNHGVDLLLDLSDLGIEKKTVGFLSDAQKSEFRALALGMSQSDVRQLFETLKSPPINSMALIEEFNLQGRDRGALVPLAREFLLDNPDAVLDPAAITQGVRSKLLRRSTHTADLNPPLGVGGGPCKVVDRIRQSIKNLRLQDVLAEEAQEGHMPNADARKIYRPDHEKGSVFEDFDITPHAQYRMDFRTITVEDVRRALNSFAKRLQELKVSDPKRYEATLAQDVIEWIDPRTRLEIVFGLGTSGEINIITTYWKGQRDPQPTDCG